MSADSARLGSFRWRTARRPEDVPTARVEALADMPRLRMGAPYRDACTTCRGTQEAGRSLNGSLGKELPHSRPTELQRE